MKSDRFAKRSETRAKYLIILSVVIFITGCAAVDTTIENTIGGLKKVAELIFKPETHTFTVVSPASYPDTLAVNSVQVRPFNVASGQSYSEQLKRMIESGIANEGYLNVVGHGADAVVSGDVNFGDIHKKAYTTSYKIGDKSYYTYHYMKKFTVTGNYSLADQSRGNTIVGDSFNFNFEKEWKSGDSGAEAEAEAMTDELIFHHVLEQIAKKVIHAVSPHKETITRELERGSDKSIKLGNTYLVNGRTDQAISIWDQVAAKTEEDKDKAAAYYNIGVVKEAQGKYKDAFELFSKANSLWPERELYIKAMTRVEEAKRLRDKTGVQLRQLNR